MLLMLRSSSLGYLIMLDHYLLGLLLFPWEFDLVAAIAVMFVVIA